jgi:acetoin utilization protein AcuC
MTQVYNIFSINQLSYAEKRAIYIRLIPKSLLQKFNLSEDLIDQNGNDLVKLVCSPGSSSTEMELRHDISFPDPLLYGHITDTINGQIHVLLYTLLDPNSPRFDVDRLPDGTKTMFGIHYRNIEAELAAMEYGLAPGQIRRGLRMLGDAIAGFEHFVQSLGQEMYFAEPLFYHNAVIFERYGFTYAKGRRLMERIQQGFSAGGDLLSKLDGSTPFRKPEAAHSIRLRSWAIHDGLLGEPFNNVTMYKYVNKSAGINTCGECQW